MSQDQASADTIHYYDTETQAFITSSLKRDMSALYQEFLARVKPGGRILDVGCGPGRDSLYFLRHGYPVTALDASQAMVDYAQKLTGQPVLRMRFEEISFENAFEGVWASASLLHVSKNELDGVIARIAKSLLPQGVFFSSFKYGDQEAITNGRFFSNHTEATFARLIQNHPSLAVEKIWKSEDNRPERAGEYWLNAICRRSL